MLALDLFSEFTDQIAVREILQGVKGRVEGYSKSMLQQNTEFAIYVLATLLCLAALVLLLFRPFTGRSWLAGLLAGIIWLVVCYAPLSIWVGAVLELFVLGALVRSSKPIS